MKKRPLAGLEAELRDHLSRETQEHIERGMAPEDARQAAFRTFGSVTLAMEDTRAVWVPVWLDQLRQDLRYAFRMVRRSPGFAGAVIATLALGVGLTTAMFSVVHAVLLNPLPYADGDRIVLVRETLRDRAGSASPGHVSDWTEQATVFDALGAGQNATFNLSGQGDPERLNGMRVTPGYFQVAYVPPALGRYFTPEEVAERPDLVVLSHGLWQRTFGADPTLVGRTVQLNGQSFTVVGVAPAAFALTDPVRAAVVGGFSAQLWTPLVFSPEQRFNYGNHSFGVLAKLKAGTSLQAAQLDLERVTRGIAERHPQAMESRGVLVLPLHDVLVGSISTQLIVLLACVGFVLLIGCTNIAGLLLARATTRRREMAIRASLGGGQPRIVRQLLTESLVLAFLGGAAALVVAQATLSYLANTGPANIPRLRDAGLQPQVLLFALGSTLVAAIACGLAPALRAARVDLQSAMRGVGAPALSGPGRDRMRGRLVVAEIAVAVVLLVGTGLLIRSARQVTLVPLGFNTHDVLTARLSLPAGRYRDGGVVAEAYDRMLEGLRAAPGVTQAGASTNIPLVGGSVDASVEVEGRVFPPGTAPSPHVRLVTDQYFEAIGMTIVRGRSLTRADVVGGAAPVVVINEQLATMLWQGEDPLGKRLSTWTAGPEPEWREVVGVVADARTFGQRTAIPLEVFLPYTQAPDGAWDEFQRTMVLALRSGRGWPDTYAPVMRRAVSTVDPSIPLYDVRTMESVFVDVTASRRFYMRLILLLAGTGLGLAVLGIYGVIAYFVTERTAEIGLRIAIGAKPRDVVRLVAGQGVRMAFLGVAIGLAAALALTRLMTALLYEVEPTDPVTFGAAGVLMILTSLLASAIPSARAARVDPLLALRAE